MISVRFRLAALRKCYYGLFACNCCSFSIALSLLVGMQLFIKIVDRWDRWRSAKEQKKFEDQLCRHMRIGKTKDVGKKWWEV